MLYKCIQMSQLIRRLTVAEKPLWSPEPQL
jgi:hypothetical protein